MSGPDGQIDRSSFEGRPASDRLGTSPAILRSDYTLAYTYVVAEGRGTNCDGKNSPLRPSAPHTVSDRPEMAFALNERRMDSNAYRSRSAIKLKPNLSNTVGRRRATISRYVPAGKRSAMHTVSHIVREFFERYERSRNTMDAGVIDEQYPDAFTFAGPTGARIGEKQAVIASLSKGHQFLKTLGHRSTTLVSLDEIT